MSAGLLGCPYATWVRLLCLVRPVLLARAQVLRDSKKPRSGIRNFKTICASQRCLVLLCEITSIVKPMCNQTPKPLEVVRKDAQQWSRPCGQ